MCVKLDLTVSSTLIMMMQSLYPYIVVVDLTKLFSGKLCQSSNNLHKDHLLSEYSETSLGWNETPLGGGFSAPIRGVEVWQS